MWDFTQYTTEELEMAMDAIVTLEEIFGAECVNEEFADAIRDELLKGQWWESNDCVGTKRQRARK